MSDENETLPATQEENADPANNGALTINADALPEQRRFAADSIRAPLPPAVYERLGQMTLTAEQEAVLNEPTPVEEIDIRPDDGMIYCSHEYVRRVLNRAFGRMGWTLIPGSPLAQEPNSKNYYRVWILFIGGVYCSEAMASHAYYPDNPRMTLDDVAEAIKSDCIRRCAKDLSIASECWNKRFAEKWRRENAIQVTAPVRKQGQTVNARLWRRKDGDPLPGELNQGSPSPTTARQPQGNDDRPPASPPAGPAPQPTKAAAPPKPAPKPPPAAAAPKPAPAAKPVTMVPDPKPASTPRLLDSQIRLLYARGRNAGLIVGDDAEPMLEFLAEFGISIITSDGKTSAENANASMKNIPVNQFTTIVKKLDELAKAAKPASTEGEAEKI